MTNRPFRWGIVGTGTIARQFADDLKFVPDAQVGAVCSRSEETAASFGGQFDSCKTYSELGALLSDPEIEGVYLATPNHLHAEQAIAAIEAGKPALVEKPFATSSRDAEAMAAAGRDGVLVMEGLWTRFLPAISALKQLLVEGAIGEVRHIRGELAYQHAADGKSRFFDPALGGGASLDLGVYLLSLAVHLLGVPTHIDGSWKAAASGVDLRADYSLRFANRAEARLCCGFDRDGDNALTITGRKGAIRLHAPFLKAQRLSVFSPPLTGLALVGGFPSTVLSRVPIPGKRVIDHAFPGGGLQFEAAAFAQSVRSGEKQNAVMPLEDSIAVLKIIEAMKARPPEKTS